MSGDAVSWDASLGTFGDLCITSELQLSPYEPRLRGKRLYGGMTAQGRRDTWQGWSLRLLSFDGTACNAMRQKRIREWEQGGADKWQQRPSCSWSRQAPRWR